MLIGVAAHETPPSLLRRRQWGAKQHRRLNPGFTRATMLGLKAYITALFFPADRDQWCTSAGRPFNQDCRPAIDAQDAI